MACRAAVASDKRFQSLSETESILKSSSLKGKALKNDLQALHILPEAEGRVHGVATEQAHFIEVVALDRGQVLYLDLDLSSTVSTLAYWLRSRRSCCARS